MVVFRGFVGVRGGRGVTTVVPSPAKMVCGSSCGGSLGIVGVGSMVFGFCLNFFIFLPETTVIQ